MGSLSLLRDKNFFSFNRSNGVSKNPSFHTGFKNEHRSLVKSAHKNFFLPKNYFTNWKFAKDLKKIGFLGKTFFRCTFYKGHMYIFEISMRRRIFWNSIRPNQRKKVIVGSMCTVLSDFSELKSPKWKQPLSISGNRS